MDISIFKHEGHDRARNVDSVVSGELPVLAYGAAVVKSWSPSVYVADPKSGISVRNKENFSYCEMMVLDVDGGLSIEDAMTTFKDYFFAIGTTKSHQIDKVKPSGKVELACDRFRVMIPLEGRITDPTTYRATWDEAFRRWPFIDISCKDPSRYYAKCSQIIYCANGGLRFPIVESTQESLPTNDALVVQQSADLRTLFSRLSKKTLLFCQSGAAKGQWHGALVGACFDMKGLGIPKGDAILKLQEATRFDLGVLDEHDLFNINDIYDNRSAGPNRHQNANAQFAKIPQGQGAYQMPVGATSQTNAPVARTEYRPRSKEELLKNILKDRSRRQHSLAVNYPFLCSVFHEVYRFTMGFIIIGAKSGKGKSTVLAAMIEHIVQQNSIQGKILVISNEENTEDVYSRIACLMCGCDWVDYRSDNLTTDEYLLIDQAIMTVVDHVVVDSVTSEGNDFSYKEDFQAALEHAEKNQNTVNGYSMIVFDYWQTVNQSKENPSKSSVDISKELGFYMKEFAARVACPVIAFAQLKGDDALDIKDRVENDKTLYNHAQDFIEIIPNFDTQKSTFKFHKNRWGRLQGQFITAKFEAGRFVPTDADNVV